MRLKALEMQGFKSFPDKTVLNFNQGITVIVGPNGSGKSNITDAVRWVLGEMSTKNIRGSKMEDVIFGGSDNRRPMGYAEVTLVIDNTEGIGRLDTEYDEVTVTRRYYRGGDSEYLINGHSSRLKEIAELFMNTGVGKTGYSNIGQGKISEIISQKGDERRAVFEEAAGISKYRYKKNEAERKLKETENNLVRLNDILNELGTRVGPLEKEAKAAKRYVELYEQKKEVDVSLWLYDAEAMRGKANETERAYMASKMQLESEDGEISELEQKGETVYQKSIRGQAEAEEVTKKVNEYIGKRYDVESAGKVIENDIQHTESRIEQEKAELEIRRRSLSEGKTAGNDLAGSVTEARRKLETAAKMLSEARAEADSHRRAGEEAEKAILECEGREKEIENELLEKRVRLSSLEGTHEAEKGRSEGIENEIAESEAAIAALSEKIERSEATLKEYGDSIEKERTKELEYIRKADEAKERSAKAKERADAANLSIEAKKHRAETLKRMDELLEGYNYSVKNVMHGASGGLIRGICGPVSKVIKVEAEYSIAIETALGANIQNIITEDEGSAKAAINYLKRTGGGRATFYPITSVKAQTPTVSASDLSKHKGYVGMADGLCDCDRKYSGVIGYMLGRTAVFDNIDNASYTAKAFGYRIRIVTLDGQLINAGGSFTGGSVKSDSGILTRASEISGLRDEITKLGIEHESAVSEMNEANGEAAEYSSKAEECRSKTALLSTLRQAEQTECEVTKSRYETESSRKEMLSSDLSGLGEQKERYRGEREKLIKEIEEGKKKLDEAKAKTGAAIVKRNEEEEEGYKAESRYNKLAVEKTAAEKDVESLESRIEINSGTIAALTEQVKRGEEHIAELTERLTKAKDSVESNRVDREGIKVEIEELEKRKGEITAQNIRYEQEQSRIREELKEKTHKREVIFREYTRLEGQREQLSTEHDRLAAKIWEDYELTYTQAAELGYPPVTDETRQSCGARQNELKNKIRALGNVNVGAIEEYEDVKTRYDFNKEQIDDLTKARESLSGIITRLEREMKTKFTEAFDDINKMFKITFKELFGGGNAEILLTDPENVLTSGIEINVAPPGKIIKNLISLSGGEQSFVAIALIFAILNVNPTPFCIFDEIESALDDVNVIRLAEYMKRYSEKTQFIAITHRRGTMEASDMIYGITMPDRGISRVLSMDVNEVEKKIGEKIS